MSEPVLTVSDLTVAIHSQQGRVLAIENVSFHLHEGEVLGLVGESGCGKSMTALALMGLLPQPVSRIVRGQIVLDGVELTGLSDRARRKLCGERLGMVFQEPMTSLNPVYKVGQQLVEALRVHRQMTYSNAWREAVEMLDRVGIPSAGERAHAYPHELSGGMRQRVMIGMALICRPRLLIADEPTTALDVSTQAQILDLLRRLRTEFGMAVLMITHDLGVIAEVADRVAVMYAGRVVEQAGVLDLFQTPQHPYSAALLRSIPRIDLETDMQSDRRQPLRTIEGAVAPPHERPGGCGFRDRCDRAQSRCRDEVPVLESTAANQTDHQVRCFFPVTT